MKAPHSASAAMDAMREFTGKMCACEDEDCAKRVSDEMVKWSQQMATDQVRPVRMSEADQKRATELGTRLGECMEHAMSVGRDPEAVRSVAEREAALALANARQAKDTLTKLMRELDELDARINAAVTAVADAQTDADREAAIAVLKALQKEQAELTQRMAAARALAERAERRGGIRISKECMDNPLAKGCS